MTKLSSQTHSSNETNKKVICWKIRPQQPKEASTIQIPSIPTLQNIARSYHHILQILQIALFNDCALTDLDCKWSDRVVANNKWIWTIPNNCLINVPMLITTMTLVCLASFFFFLSLMYNMHKDFNIRFRIDYLIFLLLGQV